MRDDPGLAASPLLRYTLKWEEVRRTPANRMAAAGRQCQHRRVTERALSFGSAAAAYARFRFGYPHRLVDDVLAYAGRPVRTALELGAGTGKATRVFADRGIAVTASEPDPAMLAELRKHVPATVTAVRAAFEELPVTGAYDLVFAAAALHWTEPKQRWPRVAGMLGPRGVFASVGGSTRLAEPAIEQAVRDVRSAVLPDDEIPSPDGTPPESPLQWPGTELVRSELFTDVRQSTIPRRATMPAADYVGYLSTVSAYLELPEADRRQLLARIEQVLPAQVAVVADLVLHLARRAPSSAE